MNSGWGTFRISFRSLTAETFGDNHLYLPLLVHLFIAGASETIENLLVELDIGTIDKILSRLEIVTIIDWMSFTDTFYKTHFGGEIFENLTISERISLYELFTSSQKFLGAYRRPESIIPL